MATGTSKSKDTLEVKDVNAIIAYTIFNKVVPKSFYHVYKWGTMKPEGITVSQYLLKEKGVSNLTLKKWFTKSQISKMENDPEGNSFDITILYVCIQRICKGTPDAEDPIWKTPGETLENHLCRLKQMRNELCHFEQSLGSKCELNEFVGNLKNSLAFIYSNAGKRYGIKENIIQKLISESEEEIANILKIDCLHDLDALSGKMALLKLNAENLVKTDGAYEIKNLVNRMSSVDFSHVMPSSRKLVDISNVFVEVDLVAGNQDSSPNVTVQNILETQTESGKTPSIIVINGDAGMGKTTLVKKIMSDWSRGEGYIHNLDQYDLILPLECRNQTVTSFEKLLRSLMPKTSKNITSEILIESVFNLNVLAIVDGWDEMNSSSNKSFLEMLQFVAGQRMQMIITTRSSRESFLNKMIPPGIEICHLKIAGVSDEKHVDFILNIDRAMQGRHQKKRDITTLLSFISNNPWCFKLVKNPLNLMILTMFWIEAPERIEYLRTSTSLYDEILMLKKERLLKRLLVNANSAQVSVEELESRLSNCLKVLYRECLESLIHGNVVLSQASINPLKEMCQQHSIPFEEVFSAFFSVDEIQEQEKQRSLLIHKEFCEFYGAIAILDCLKRPEHDKVVKKVKKGLKEILVENHLPVGVTKEIEKEVEKKVRKSFERQGTVLDVLKDLHEGDLTSFQLVKYQKVLVHLIGLLKLHDNLSQTLATDLIKLLKESGMMDSDDWLNILAETECDSKIVDEVKELINTEFLYIRDGHVKAAYHLLDQVEFKYVSVDISGDPNKLKDLKKMLKILRDQNTQLKLTIMQHWRYPELGSSDDFLNCLSGSNKSQLRISHFVGSVKSLSSLERCDDTVFVSIGMPYAKNRNRHERFLVNNSRSSKHLFIHISCGTPVDCFPVLSDKIIMLDLWLSGVGDSDIEWVGNSLKKFSSKMRSFWSLRFPRSTLTAEGCTRLVEILRRHMIGRDGIFVASSMITRETAQAMQETLSRQLSKPFHISDEVKVWAFCQAV